ncbi:MAG: response regulator transcription factor [Firmicutes bacterium]|nr:response regulator transcription factor [Bacillota bacterium]MCL5038418.1 response regulator transcription factor [Bacillota bacterium]
MPASVLVVEDDPRIQKIIVQTLRKEGYQILTSSDGTDALQKVRAGRPDLILLDLRLPGMDGLEVCRELRKEGSLPIIIVSARGEEVDKVAGFTLGADDYITKPFSPTELLLRVKAVLRRVQEHRDQSGQERIRLRGLVIDRISRTVEVGGKPVELTAREFDLLWILAGRPNRVFSREQLLDLVWKDEFDADPATVTVLIRRLRQKLEKEPDNPEYIKTVWGVGYKMQGQ